MTDRTEITQTAAPTTVKKPGCPIIYRSPSGNWHTQVSCNGKRLSITGPTPEYVEAAVKKYKEDSERRRQIMLENSLQDVGKYIVYQHIFPDGKSYVGITGDSPNRRWKNGSGYKNQKVMSAAIEKFGWDNIEHRILFKDLTLDEACLYEKCLVKLLNLTDRDNGYNYTGGGELHLNHSKITIRLEDGREYSSATEAAKEIEAEPFVVQAICQGRKIQVNGWSFMYKKDFDALDDSEKLKYKWYAKKVAQRAKREMYNTGPIRLDGVSLVGSSPMSCAKDD